MIRQALGALRKANNSFIDNYKKLIALSAYQQLLLFLFLCFQSHAQAQDLTEIDELHFVADIDNAMPGAVTDIYSNDDALVKFNLISQTTSSNNDLSILDQAGIDGFHNADNCGDSLYSLDISALVAGVAVRPSDVFTADGVKILDAELAGIPAGINIDALSRDPKNCDLIISIDSSALIGNSPLDGVFKADDLIRWNSTTGFSFYQITKLNANIDALHVFSPSRILISLDVGGDLGDIKAFDEDVLEINPCTGNSFQLLALQTALLDTSWQSADLNALWAKQTSTTDLIFSDGFDDCQGPPN